MIKLVTILGARPQFIKAVAVSAAIRKNYSHVISELILHTGQHYDENMSDIFFEELGLPRPHFQLNAASSNKSLQVGEMIDGINAILKDELPDLVLVYGDTTSTLAGALAASGLKIPLVHIEAGLRSFNKSMPEELNRIVCDQLSTMLFTPTQQAIQNLAHEGMRYNAENPVSLSNPGIFECGDVMLDVARIFKERITAMSWKDVGLIQPTKKWILCTLHREQNTSNRDNLRSIVQSILTLPGTQDCEIVWPLHPRTKKLLESAGETDLLTQLWSHPAIHLCEPLSYLQTQFLLHHCGVVLTDSGGLQKEAFFAGKPSVIMRNETEWVELLDGHYTILCDCDQVRMTKAVTRQWNKDLDNSPSFYGNGNAAASILNTIVSLFDI
ncbi:MAG: non-hydrolyzing UDP-N-acetylglucosamine 2-epimerase [Flavobacteriales bacterium]